MTSHQQLEVIVIGAGIGGIAAAICCANQGHTVQVFEVSAKLSELGAGIQIPPNAARILDRWGLGDVLEQKATVPSEENLRRFSNGDVVGQQRRNTKALFGYSSMVIHRADFQKLLYDSAVERGVKFEFGRKVSVDEIAIPTISNAASTLRADVVIAADGISSSTRYKLVGKEGSEPKLTGDTASRIVLSKETLRSDSNLRHLVSGPTNNVWMGPKRHVVAYTMRNLELYNVVLCGPGEAPVGVYNEPYQPEVLSKEYADFEPVVRGIIDKAETAHRWMISEVPPLPRWTDGRIVLLGDAAHAMMPYAAQGAAQCIEDAAILGLCLSQEVLGKRKGIDWSLRQFELLRRDRTERIQEVARGNRFLYGLEDGPEQRERDERLSQSTNKSQSEHSQQPDSRPEPDSQAKYGTPEFSEWLYGMDVESDARVRLQL